MEIHGGTHVDETGLEGHMWQLGLNSGPESYPERPGEPDCSYFLRRGSCGFGNRCRFNHPRDRSVASEASQASGGEYPQRIGQPLCHHYVRTGTCKFGSSCKYHHPREGPAPVVVFNFHGYPLRQGEDECAYYLKTGFCKFGSSCKFHHPQPAGAELPPPPPPQKYPPPPPPTPTLPHQQYGNLIQISQPMMLSSSYVPGSYGPLMVPQGIIAVPSWTPYPLYASGHPTVSAGPVYGLSSSTTTSYAAREYPQRPGEPECRHYLRMGGCKFGSACKFHHPPDAKAGPVLGPMRLPSRPVAPICSHYSRNGTCGFGPSCKFNHPMRAISYSSSTSSFADIPVAPHPGGSKDTAVAASSCSSSSPRLELRREGDDVASPCSNTTAGGGRMLSVRQDSSASSHGL